MIRLLKFGGPLTNVSWCGNIFHRTKTTAKLFVPVRSHMSRTSELLESKLRANDMVPDGFRLVYRGGMDYYIHLAHQSSAILTFFAISTGYKLIFVDDDPIVFPVHDKIIPISLHNPTQICIMYATFFLMMFGMRQISSRYVLRMYYNEATRTYRAIKVGWLPMATTSHEFRAGTLTKATRRRVIPWLNGSYDAGGTKVLLMGGGFKTSSDYYRLFKE